MRTEEPANLQKYDFVFSFAGEDREVVRSLAKILTFRGVSLFFDEYEDASIWGTNLVEHLQKIFGESALYCVPFISKYYADKIWPRHEVRSAMATAVAKAEAYVLPVRLDDTKIPGILESIAYFDLRQKSVADLADACCRRLILQERDRPGTTVSALDVMGSEDDWLVAKREDKVRCPECGGSGTDWTPPIDIETQPRCMDCYGTGKVSVYELLEEIWLGYTEYQKRYSPAEASHDLDEFIKKLYWCRFKIRYPRGVLDLG